ncbi:U32 family peptidase [Methanofollis fontis]|uniref:Peptidase U32 n=1 Tax=Methanofollis fontis TaxID=2052832 RepID=A0A483CQF2_9EURY|nr:U32 family peptidase [Methanofollis fontis]TAJ45343.1 peptidase U32 [Methanofollis fontis]
MHTKPREIPELLAPAGSREALVAAVAAGADAVYLGGTRFSARRFATNFDDDALAEAVDYAHARGVSVHVTVNTLIREDELPAVGSYLLFLYRIGVDAVLVQDAGVLALARRIVPDLPVHASTQMAISSADGLAWAASMGVDRVVLARELSGAEIEGMREVVEQTGTELEIFVHGALCYAYSGQCLLSSLIGGRSGNRGACAQPCRKPYTLLRGGTDRFGRPEGMAPVAEGGPYPLSTRDLCLYPLLEGVVALPVASLKIEGRMKAPAYVAIVTEIYRRALDSVAAGRFVPSAEDELDLAFAFNRGFTRGYLTGARHTGVIGPERPDNRGVEVGSVLSFSRSRMEATVALTGQAVPENGDGCVVCSQEGEVGFVVRGTPPRRGGTVVLRLPRPAPPGAVVAITRRGSLERRAVEIIQRERQAVRIDASVRWEADGTPVIDAVCTPPRRKGVEITVRGETPMGAARTRPLGAEAIAAHLRKTGGTQFFIGSLDLAYPGGLFAPPSYLNDLRRRMLLAAEEALVRAARPDEGAVRDASRRCAAAVESLRAPPAPAVPFLPCLSVYTDTAEGVRAAQEGGADRICFEPLHPSGEVLQEAVDCAAPLPLIWMWPTVIRKAFLDTAVPLLPCARIAGVMVGGHGGARAVCSAAPAMPLSGGAGLNVWNHCAALSHPGLSPVTLSPELGAADIAALITRLPPDGPEARMIVQGTAVAMITEDCPPATALGCPSGCGEERFALRDERGRIFPLHPDGDCRMRIGNAVETCLIDHLPALAAAGVRDVVVDARGRGPDYTARMTALYRRALDAIDDPVVLRGLKDEVRALALGGITAASYLRGTE